ncbi:MAG TPA: hypothetical protein PKO16_00540 [Bacteroidia bacterium]|nr:hypothetical protein [Bacteroidia bacterium]
MIARNVVTNCCNGEGVLHTSCCKTCFNCPNCYDLTFDRINDIIYSIETKLSEESEKFLCERNWGFSKTSLKNNSKKVLSLYLDALLRYRKSLLSKNPVCLCDTEVQSVIENSLDLVDISCIFDSKRCDIVTDDSYLDAWLLSNPGCFAFEDWEERLNWVIPKVGISVKEVSESFKLLYILNVSRAEDCHKILYNLTVYSKAVNDGCYDINVDVTKVNCDLDYNFFIKDLEKCKIQFNTLIKEVECNINLTPEVRKVLCKLDFNTYTKLLECNLSTSVISTLLNCGINVRFNAENKCGELEVNGKVILLDEGFNVDILGDDVDLSLLEGLVGKKCYVDTPIVLSEYGYGS